VPEEFRALMVESARNEPMLCMRFEGNPASKGNSGNNVLAAGQFGGLLINHAFIRKLICSLDVFGASDVQRKSQRSGDRERKGFEANDNLPSEI
jgi:hypothetical protein